MERRVVSELIVLLSFGPGVTPISCNARFPDCSNLLKGIIRTVMLRISCLTVVLRSRLPAGCYASPSTARFSGYNLRSKGGWQGTCNEGKITSERIWQATAIKKQ